MELSVYSMQFTRLPTERPMYEVQDVEWHRLESTSPEAAIAEAKAKGFKAPVIGPSHPLEF